MTLRFAPQAEADIVQALRTSRREHGDAAKRRYQTLLGLVFARLEADPVPASSRPVDHLLPGTRRLALKNLTSLCREAGVREPRHVIYYSIAADQAVEVLALLHDAMEPGLHLPHRKTTGGTG